MTPKPNNESKTDRFKRIAARRTQNVLDSLRKLGNCSNRGSYQYKEEEIAKIFSTIDKELKRIRVLFTTKENNNTFSL